MNHYFPSLEYAPSLYILTSTEAPYQIGPLTSTNLDLEKYKKGGGSMMHIEQVAIAASDQSTILYGSIVMISTYGHSQLKTGHPVRSAIHKQLNGRLVLRWVTTWESLLLYVLLTHGDTILYPLVFLEFCSLQPRARHVPKFFARLYEASA
jgi:hypothetical protein